MFRVFTVLSAVVVVVVVVWGLVINLGATRHPILVAMFPWGIGVGVLLTLSVVLWGRRRDPASTT